jgi:hypothetical protein
MRSMTFDIHNYEDKFPKAFRVPSPSSSKACRSLPGGMAFEREGCSGRRDRPDVSAATASSRSKLAPRRSGPIPRRLLSRARLRLVWNSATGTVKATATNSLVPITMRMSRHGTERQILHVPVAAEFGWKPPDDCLHEAFSFHLRPAAARCSHCHNRRPFASSSLATYRDETAMSPRW